MDIVGDLRARTRGEVLAPRDGGYEAARAAYNAVQASPTPMAMFHFRILGGQMARVPADATAFAHRDARFMVMIGRAVLAGGPGRHRVSPAR